MVGYPCRKAVRADSELLRKTQRMTSLRLTEWYAAGLYTIWVVTRILSSHGWRIPCFLYAEPMKGEKRNGMDRTE